MSGRDRTAATVSPDRGLPSFGSYQGARMKAFICVFLGLSLSPISDAGHRRRGQCCCPCVVHYSPASPIPMSFGLPNSFSGRLSAEQESLVPEDLRNVFHVESVREAPASVMHKSRVEGTLVAEETRNGHHFIAVRVTHCVHFSDSLSGMMIVIERYRIIGE